MSAGDEQKRKSTLIEECFQNRGNFRFCYLHFSENDELIFLLIEAFDEHAILLERLLFSILAI